MTEKLIAERNRYREALKRIAGCYPHELGEAYTMHSIAREAIGTSQVPTDDGRQAVQAEIDAKDSL